MQEGKVYLDQDYDIKITLLDDELRLKNATTANKELKNCIGGFVSLMLSGSSLQGRQIPDLLNCWNVD